MILVQFCCGVCVCSATIADMFSELSSNYTGARPGIYYLMLSTIKQHDEHIIPRTNEKNVAYAKRETVHIFMWNYHDTNSYSAIKFIIIIYI